MKNNPFPEESISPFELIANIEARAKARIESGFVDKEQEIADAKRRLSEIARQTTIDTFRSVTHNSIVGMDLDTAKRIQNRGNAQIMDAGIRRPPRIIDTGLGN